MSDVHDGPDRCPRCGDAFTCGIASGSCWCAALTPLPVLPLREPGAEWRGDAEGAAGASATGGASADRCLCPRCLVALGARARGD